MPTREPRAQAPPAAVLAAAVGLALGILLRGAAPPAPSNAPAPAPAPLAAQGPAPPPVEAPAPALPGPVPAAEPQPVPSQEAELRPFDPRDLACRRVSPGAELPGARLLGRGSDGHVYAAIMPSDAGSDHSVFIGGRLIGTSRGATGREAVDLGPFAYGRSLDVSIQVQDAELVFRSGPGAGNPDRQVHATVTSLGPGAWRVGFEDLEGGGDGDFNDAIIELRGDLAAESEGALHCGPAEDARP